MIPKDIQTIFSIELARQALAERRKVSLDEISDELLMPLWEKCNGDWTKIKRIDAATETFE